MIRRTENFREESNLDRPEPERNTRKLQEKLDQMTEANYHLKEQQRIRHLAIKEILREDRQSQWNHARASSS